MKVRIKLHGTASTLLSLGRLVVFACGNERSGACRSAPRFRMCCLCVAGLRNGISPDLENEFVM